MKINKPKFFRVKITALLLGIILGVTPAKADGISVVTSIKPIQSLVTMVLGDLGEVHALIPDGASPHNVIMRPSDRMLLAKADLVVMIDPYFEMAFAKALPTGERLILVSGIPGLTLLDRRSSGAFGHNAHEETHDNHDEHAHQDHEDHDEHAHEDHDDHDEHAHEGSTDLHLWLMPSNAVVIMNEIAVRLTQLYPEHRITLRDNLAAAKKSIAALDAELSASLTPIKDKPFVVYHDAYFYFEQSYGLNIVSTILNHHDSAAEINRIRFLRELIAEDGIACIFHEPQFSSKILDTVDPDGVVPKAMLDPIGEGLEEGPDLYATVLRNIASVMLSCMSKS